MNKVIICAKEYPSRVTMGAMIDFKRETGRDVNEIGADVEQLTMFMYCCVRSACRADKIDFALTFEQFCRRHQPGRLYRLSKRNVNGRRWIKKKKGTKV